MSKEVFGVEIDGQAGFFGQLNWCLDIFDYCHKSDLLPYIELNGKYGKNWLTNYFEYITPIEKPTHTPKGNNKLDVGVQDAPKMTFKHANMLFNKYLKFKGYIVDLLSREAYFSTLNEQRNKNVLGVHYRGNDKMLVESPNVVRKEVFWKHVKEKIGTRRFDAVYIATDDQDFLDFVKDQTASNSTLNLQYRQGEIKATKDTAIHHRPSGDKWQKGYEALVNCYLLSHCTEIIKTPSALSGWAKVFNPELPVTLIGDLKLECFWFPDSEFINARLRAQNAR